MGTLYIVATPIGNLEDITLRALRVLREVGLIVAEDTRITRKLLRFHGISTPITSYFEHNKLSKLDVILEALRDSDVALVSDAGTPGLSDPGLELVQAAVLAGFPVVPIPGPSAITAAAAASGLPATGILFFGFLPRRSGDRSRFLRSVASLPYTLILFEAPHRLGVLLEDLLSILGDRRLAVCRELTKVHEEVFRGTVSEAIRYLTEPRGEFTLVIEGAKVTKPPLDVASVKLELAALKRQSMPAKEAIAKVCGRFGLSRREAYRLWNEL